MRQNTMKILWQLKFFSICWACASVPSLSVAEDIVTSASKCSDAVQKYAGMTPQVGSEKVDAGWFTDVVTWSENSIECEVSVGDVVSLRIGDRMYVVDGFAGAAAKAAFAQMEANLDNAEETMDATVRDLKVALEDRYKPMLVEPSPDVARIQEEFAEEISRATGTLYRGFYAENHERIALLDEIEQSGDEEALALQLVKLRKELDQANAKNEEVTAWASQLQDKISTLEQKVSEREHDLSEFTRMTLEANLEKDLAMVEAQIQNLEFSSASDKIRELEQNGLLEQSDRDRLEALTLSTVRPLPASEAELNKSGYQLLHELNRDSEEYRAKVARYSVIGEYRKVWGS